MRLNGKTAVVIGASGDIGHAIASLLAAEGASILLHYFSGVERVRALALSLEKMGVPTDIVPADVSERHDVERVLAKALESFGRVDILINGAGINTPADVFGITDASWDRVLDVNLKGAFLCCQVVGRHMLEIGSGHIVNVASTAGITPLGRSHHYVASKAGLIGLTRSLAREFAPRVLVNAVAPGYIATTRHLAMDLAEEEAVLARIPMGRMGSVSEVAAVVRFLVCDGNYMTGQVIAIDGGMALRMGGAD